MIASEEVGFSKAMDVGQLFRTRALCDARDRSAAPYCITNQDPSKDPTMIRNIPGTATMVQFYTSLSQKIDVFCNDIEVSSPVHNTAWIRTGRGVTQWARQTSEFEPEIEGTETVQINVGTALAHAQPEDPDLCIRRPIA